MKKKRFSNDVQRRLLLALYFSPVVFAPLLIYFVGYRPKAEICRTYYPEISDWSCLMSNYGLPTRGGK